MTKDKKAVSVQSLCTDFHTYTIRLTRDKAEFAIDGILLLTKRLDRPLWNGLSFMDPYKRQPAAPFNLPRRPKIWISAINRRGLAVEGDDHSKLSRYESVYKPTLEIDFSRVYQN